MERKREREWGRKEKERVWREIGGSEEEGKGEMWMERRWRCGEEDRETYIHERK